MQNDHPTYQQAAESLALALRAHDRACMMLAGSPSPETCDEFLDTYAALTDARKAAQVARGYALEGVR